MDKLIVVGMRFQEAYAKNRPTISEEVVLLPEPNNKTNSRAVAVYFETKKIGYIRDLDLHYLEGVKFPVVYKIERICTNYLQLRYSPESTETKANEFFYDISLGPKAHAEYDLFYQDYIKSVQASKNSEPYQTKIEKYLTGGLITKNPCSEVFLGSPGTHEFTEPTKQPTENKKMNFNTNSMRDSFFKEVTNVAMDMQTGKLGVVTSQGIITATDEGVSVNPITEMGFKIPAFAMRVPVAELSKGDIIIGNGDPVFFMEGSKVGYLTVNTNGVIQETGQVANMFFGKNTVMAVKNMFGDSQSGGMNPMLMMAMMGDRKEGSGFGFKEMMMMQMMSNNKDMGGMNPMMMMMFMGDK